MFAQPTHSHTHPHLSFIHTDHPRRGFVISVARAPLSLFNKVYSALFYYPHSRQIYIDVPYILCIVCVCVFIMPDLFFVMCKQLCKQQQQQQGATKTKQNGTLITLAGLKALITAGLILQCWQSQKNN